MPIALSWQELGEGEEGFEVVCKGSGSWLRCTVLSVEQLRVEGHGLKAASRVLKISSSGFSCDSFGHHRQVQLGMGASLT